MKTVSDLIESFGGGSELARRLNIPVPTVGAWKFRGSIPATHFLKIVKLAEAQNLKGVTLERLHALNKADA